MATLWWPYKDDIRQDKDRIVMGIAKNRIGGETGCAVMEITPETQVFTSLPQMEQRRVMALHELI